MTAERRVVRTPPDFYWALDAQLGTERGPNGEPSRNDFVVHDLLKIVDLVAEHFDDLPRVIAGRDEYRQVLTVGRWGAKIAVLAQLAPDGGVDLIDVSLDFAPDVDPDVDPEDPGDN